MHKDVQDKVVTELRQVFGSPHDKNLTIDFDALNKLNYLEMVINETLRILPVVPFVVRSVENDIQVADYKIPAGANVGVPIYKIHRSKELWGEDANEFKPERFEKEKFKSIHPYAFIPFTSKRKKFFLKLKFFYFNQFCRGTSNVRWMALCDDVHENSACTHPSQLRS
jgi:cytochrome P450 family 313